MQLRGSVGGNRVFSDKPHGLIVDYIGIGDSLREATSQYSKSGGKGEPTPDVETEGKKIFNQALQDARACLPSGRDYGGWRSTSDIDIEDFYALVYGFLAAEDIRRDDFIQAEAVLSSAFLLVKHLDDCRQLADEIIFYQRVRKQILKTTSGRRTVDLDRAVQDLVDDNIHTEGVIDIFKVAGIDKPDISMLDDPSCIRSGIIHLKICACDFWNASWQMKSTAARRTIWLGPNPSTSS